MLGFSSIGLVIEPASRPCFIQNSYCLSMHCVFSWFKRFIQKKRIGCGINPDVNCSMCPVCLQRAGSLPVTQFLHSLSVFCVTQMLMYIQIRHQSTQYTYVCLFTYTSTCCAMQQATCTSPALAALLLLHDH